MGLDRSRLPEPLAYFEREGVKLEGRGKWRTFGCIHGSTDSGRANVETGGFVCMAGCGFKGGDVLAFHMQRHGLEFVEACKALGAWIEDDKPSKHRQAPLSFSARAGLEVVALECLLVAVAAGNLARGVELATADRERLLQAAKRIRFIAEEVAR